MECAVCHKKESSKTRCIQGHYVCSECHTQGMDSIIGLCLHEHSKNPIKIIDKMMAMPFCHMHGPEHHVMVGAALLTAYHNAGGKVGALEGSAGDVPPRKRGSREEPVVFGEPAEQGSVRGCICRLFKSTPLAKKNGDCPIR